MENNPQLEEYRELSDAVLADREIWRLESENANLFWDVNGDHVEIEARIKANKARIKERTQEIAAQFTKPKSPWIPVTERLPEAKGRYFVMDRWGDAGMGDAIPTYVGEDLPINDLNKDKYEMRFMDYVTHWMPIPE